MVCKEFSVLHLTKNTVHRGIKNSADYDRPMFYCLFSPDENFDFKERAIESDSNIEVKDN